MPFFVRNRKRKSAESGISSKFEKKDLKTKGKPSKKKKILDEEIESDSDLSGDDQKWKENAEVTSSEDEEETAEEKKLRLAKQYLSQIETEEVEKRQDEDDDAELNRDLVSHRLKQDILEQSGRLQKEVADSYEPPTVDDISVLRGHQLSVTCIVISPDNRHVFSGSKDCCIIKWDAIKKKKVRVIQGGRRGSSTSDKIHTTDQILCLAISYDGKYLASGGCDKIIHIWNPATCEHIHHFTGHRSTVSSLSFRKGTYQLFSASHDRSVRIWNADERSYIETLFGHMDSITGIDSLTRDRAVTSGGRDGSVRIWKVLEESQLVFHGHAGSIDCIALINESNFVTGGDDNSLAVWGVMKKKPLVFVKNAHGKCDNNNVSMDTGENWITAVASHQNTDLIASGCKDGCVRLWKCSNNFKSLTPLFTVPVKGFVNSLEFSKNGDILVVGVGQEHKLGRWWRIKDSKNSVCVINLKKNLNT